MASFQSLPRPTKTYHTTTYERIAKRHGFQGSGKTILVTGGAQGIGYSMCLAFAEAGVARIAIVSRSAGPQEETKRNIEAAFPSVQVLPYQASITDNIRIQEILRELGTIDVLVLCASHAHRRAKAADLEAKEMLDAFETNVMASFNITKAYIASPSPVGGRKTMLHLSSAAGLIRAPLRAGYGMSKTASTQLLGYFASESGLDNLKIVSFHPGSFYTPSMTREYAKDAFVWDDINLPAHFALWLASSESDFLNGRCVWAHWDVDELLALKERVLKDPSFLKVGLLI